MVEAMVAVTRKPRAALIAVLLATALVQTLGAPVVAKPKATVYEPPFKEGPSGGDEWNYHSSDPGSGEMSVYRLFPGFSPVVGCEPEPDAGWATFVVVHKAGSVRHVKLSFDEAELDPYAWMTLGARDSTGDWFGVSKLQGFRNGSGDLVLKLGRPTPAGRPVTIEFGLQLGDSCPQLSFAHALFSSVEVK